MDSDTGGIHGSSDGGVTGKHPETDPPKFFIAPSTGSEFNVLQFPLVPVACWRVDDIRFAFDSSFVTSGVTTEIRQFWDLREDHAQTDISGTTSYPPLSVWGHADPTGTDDYNKSTHSAGGEPAPFTLSSLAKRTPVRP